MKNSLNCLIALAIFIATFNVAKAQSDNLGKKIKTSDSLMRAVGLIKPDSFLLEVDYSINTLDQVSWVYSPVYLHTVSNRTPLLPANASGGKKEILVKVFFSGAKVDFQKIIAEMALEGYRPATLTEILPMFESGYCNLWDGFILGAIGSKFQKSEKTYVPFLIWNADGRRGINAFYDGNIPSTCKFLGVKN